MVTSAILKMNQPVEIKNSKFADQNLLTNLKLHRSALKRAVVFVKVRGKLFTAEGMDIESPKRIA